MMRDVTAAMLVGGRSRRMGRDKAALLGGRVAERLDGHFAALLRIGRPQDLLRPHCTLTGIHAALTRARTRWVFVVACDMPRVSVALARRLRRRRGRVIVPVGPDGPQPLHALYRRDVRGAIARLVRAGRLKVGDMLETLGAVRVRVRDARPFFNVNTPSDLKRLPRASERDRLTAPSGKRR